MKKDQEIDTSSWVHDISHLSKRTPEKRSKNFNIELREVIFGCCVPNTYDDDTMSPDVCHQKLLEIVHREEVNVS